MVDAICIHSYTSDDQEVHNLNIGDKLLVIPINEDWCRAKLNGVEAFAPMSYLQLEPHDWYKGRINHELATNILFEKDTKGDYIQEDGAFIIRDNITNPGFFSLTIKWKNLSQKYRIYYENEKYKISDEYFESFNKLINYHKRNSINPAEIILLKEFKKLPTSRAITDYNGNKSSQLSFKTGDIIRILDCRDANWYKGELNYQYGLVPARYLESLDFF